MPRKKKWSEDEDEFKPPFFSYVNPDVKKSIVAVLLLGVTIVLILASFGQAGPVGKFLFKSLTGLLGLGYYLVPLVALVIAVIFLLAQEIKVVGPTLWGGLLLIIASLGLIDIVFPQSAGLVGNLVGFIEKPFGRTASLVVVITVILAAIPIILNIPIRIKRKGGKEELTINDPTAMLTSAPAQPSGEKTREETKVIEAMAKPAINLRLAAITKARGYKPPPLSLLNAEIDKPTAGDLRANANIIKRTLESFGIPVEMGEISIGPKVTRYTLKPAEGIKLVRLTALNQDLSLALAAHPLRIEAPIPGKSLVGIEVPNKTAALVRLGSLMNYPEFTKTGPLAFIIGRDVNGDPITANIEKMPHLLVSGSTGSGKSIFIHSLIASMLYKNSPEILRFIMIDPKRVELSVYNGIAHLVSPVIVEGKKAINVFRWAIQEMEERYEKLLKAGARDISSYNTNGRHGPMPYIMIVVDELADLMAAHGREVESAVVRLAQMARATGIHLVLATQRPSVEVITGLIKANITARVALQVASQVDSRTILDSAGAEKLLSGGDMLFVSAEFSKPRRIQGAYISEGEIQKVARFVRDNNPPQIKEEMPADGEIKIEPLDFEKLAELEGDDDELYPEAAEVVRQARKASASLLQRRLKVGYARAARLLDLMEAKGIIGPGAGAKPREVYLDKIPPPPIFPDGETTNYT